MKTFQQTQNRYCIIIIFLLFTLILGACDAIEDICDEISSASDNYDRQGEWDEQENVDPGMPETQDAEISPTEPVTSDRPINPEFNREITSKWDLWASDSTQLRGANIWQALVLPDLDGPTFKGSGHVGPPFTQDDFYAMAQLGANYVTISGPGLFSEEPPFVLDMAVVEHLDGLLEMIANADMFATISFRTGPGRSECTFWCDPYDPEYMPYFNDTLWEDRTAQDAWVEMWAFAAERYRDNPIVIGYKLMVEPNAASVYFDIWEPEEFYSAYAGSTYDWNQLHPRIIAAIRSVDSNTPILVNAEGYSAIEWLPYVEIVDESNIVYIAHQYHPYEQYTHQYPDGRNAYPGQFDLDWDGQPDDFNRQWLQELLGPLREFAQTHNVPVAVDEFGVVRWVPGAAVYMNDLMGLFEQQGINYSFWEWSTSWHEFEEEVHAMNYRFGPDPDNRSLVESDLLNVIRHYWSLNNLRPSNAPWVIGHSE